jgi:murein DD-endopeptidase MepM/ murein hydrolase activator NlpD
MKKDYIAAEPARRRPSARRSVLIVSLCLVSIAGLMAREGSASRQHAAKSAQQSEAQTLLLQTQTEIDAFETAVQDALSTTLEIPPASGWITVKVKPGQTFSAIIEGEGMPKSDWLEVLALKGETARLKRLRAGEKFHLRKNAEGRLEELSFELDETQTLQIRRVDQQLEALILAAEMDARPAQAQAHISSSLFASGLEAGLSNRLIMELAEIFGYDIDFALDLRQGDRFTVIYEEIFKNGEKLRDGNILLAEFVNQNRTFRAMRHEDEQGNAAYYTPDGQSVRTAFLRSPVDFARISSRFNLRRMHPILNTIRAHKGVDYAAGTGTPIKATGDGKIVFMGVKGGYGRVVIVKHGTQYETLYAHMSRYRAGLGVGSRVRQGQVIGYVGATGLATAPHLHYEFRVRGIHKNPMTVPLPRANPLSKSELAVWKSQNAHLLAQLDALSQAQQFAQQNAAPAPVRLAQ